MKLLPHRRFTIETQLPPAEVAARLRDAIAPARTFSLSKPTRPLVGAMDGNTFDIMRNVQGRNSFRPRVRGAIEPAGRGTRLIGTMRLHELVLLFMGALLTVTGSVFLSMVIGDLRSGQFGRETLIALGVIVFLAGMTIGGFIPETRRVLDELVRLVDAPHGDLR